MHRYFITISYNFHRGSNGVPLQCHNHITHILLFGMYFTTDSLQVGCFMLGICMVYTVILVVYRPSRNWGSGVPFVDQNVCWGFLRNRPVQEAKTARKGRWHVAVMMLWYFVMQCCFQQMSTTHPILLNSIQDLYKYSISIHADFIQFSCRLTCSHCSCMMVSWGGHRGSSVWRFFLDTTEDHPGHLFEGDIYFSGAKDGKDMVKMMQRCIWYCNPKIPITLS